MQLSSLERRPASSQAQYHSSWLATGWEAQSCNLCMYQGFRRSSQILLPSFHTLFIFAVVTLAGDRNKKKITMIICVDCSQGLLGQRVAKTSLGLLGWIKLSTPPLVDEAPFIIVTLTRGQNKGGGRRGEVGIWTILVTRSVPLWLADCMGNLWPTACRKHAGIKKFLCEYPHHDRCWLLLCESDNRWERNPQSLSAVADTRAENKKL